MTARTITNKSMSAVRPISCKTAPSLKTSENAALLNLINKSNWGKITGKPKIAINAAFCWALAAMALINVNTKLMPIPPKITIPVN